MNERESLLSFRLCGIELSLSLEAREKLNLVAITAATAFFIYCIAVGESALSKTGVSAFVALYSAGYLAISGDDRSYLLHKIKCMMGYQKTGRPTPM